MSTDRFIENQTYYRVLQGDSASHYLADGAPNQIEMVTFVGQENIRSPHTGMQILTYVFEKSDGTTVYDSGEPLEYAYFKFNLDGNHMNNIYDFLKKMLEVEYHEIGNQLNIMQPKKQNVKLRRKVINVVENI